MFLAIKNNGKRSIKVLWQESGYVSPAGNIERIFFGGIKFFGRYSEQLPTRIFNNASISNKVTVYLFIDEELKRAELLRPKITIWTKKDEAEANAAKMSFRFIIVLDVSGEIKEYDFHFGANVEYKK